MAYRIDKKDGFFEVHIAGETSKHEVIEIIRELHRRDPGKKHADLWFATEESQVPFAQFREIAEATRSLLPKGAVGNKAAFVAANPFQQAQIEMYRSEASIVPFEIRVFRSRDEAIAWIKTP